MKLSDVLGGFAIGAVAFYVTSLGSSFWVTNRNANDYLWAAILTFAGFVGAPLYAAVRHYSGLVASGVMLVLIFIGYLAGGPAYFTINPVPQDLTSLLFHGGRSPLVLGLAFAVGTFSLYCVLTGRSQRPRPSIPPGQ